MSEVSELVGRLVTFETGQVALIKRWDFRSEVARECHRDEDPNEKHTMRLDEVEVQLEDGTILVGAVCEDDFLIMFDDKEKVERVFGIDSLIFGFDAFVGENGEEATPVGAYFAVEPGEDEQD
jgi:hypothetical protein